MNQISTKSPTPALKSEDILLLAVIFVISKEGKSNNMLLMALIFIFLSGF